jgi:hypothetical protein
MQAKFNGIALGELTVNFLETPSKVTAKGAFINKTTGSTHGWTTCHQWSAETLEKLKELRACMEQDMLSIHFLDVLTLGPKEQHIRESLKGLGEHLGSAEEDIPQG